MLIKLKIVNSINKIQLNQSKELLLTTFKNINIKSSELEEHYNSSNVYSTLVAIENNKVIGTAIVNHQTGYFGWLAVDKKYQNKGTGSKLCKRIEAILKKKKIKQITLDTRNQFKSALIMYLKNGYEINGTFLHHDGELMIRMSKKIT
jgi:ribosomal protein S18 acetylase RimI-like enzyme